MSAKNIVFIDSRVSNYQALIDSLTESYEVFILNSDSDGVDQMAAYLDGRSGLDAIHVISHGSVGALYLGSTVLNSGNLSLYESQLASIGSSLTQAGDILLYGCNVAQGDVGLQFITSLAQYTGADVAASTDATGAQGLGGDWVLEQVSGSVQADSLPVNRLAGLLIVNTAPTFVVSDGKAITKVGPDLSDDQSYGIAIQPNGKILLVGTSFANFDIALVRYNIDGSLDTSFDADGIATTSIGPSWDYGYGIAVQTDGKILVAGSSLGLNAVSMDFALLRYNNDGSLDTSFDTDGIITTAVGSYADYCQSIVVQKDGKILLGGYSLDATSNYASFSLVRYNIDGNLDTSFDVDGKVFTNIGNQSFGRSIKLQADGKIILGGTSDNNFLLIRYNVDGSLDSNFGIDGKIITDFGSLSSGNSIFIQEDGKILLCGSKGNYFALTRYNTNGTLDNSFDGDGKVLTAVNSDSYGTCITVQGDGKILIGGYSSSGGWDFALARYNTDGSLDNSFDNDGKLATDFDSFSRDFSYSVTVQTDGKILLGGSSNGDFALIRYNIDGSLDTSFSPPENTISGSPTYTEGFAPIILDWNIQILDVDLAAVGNYNGSSLVLARHGAANPQDVFSAASSILTALTPGSYFAADGVTIGRVTTNSAGTLSLAFNANATQSLVNKAMQQIAYANTSDAPPASVQIDWTFSDGNTGAQGTGGAMSVTGRTTVQITAVNDAPHLAASIPDLTVQAQSALSYTVPAETFIDPDGDTLTWSMVMADGTGVPPWLTFNPTTKTLGGTPSIEDAGSLSLRITATDPSGASATDFVNVIVAVNTPPTLNISFVPEPTGRNGMTVFIDSFTAVDLGNGYTSYQVTYTEKNLTSSAIDQATLRLYFSDAEPAPQYGFFDRVLPGEQYATTRSYSFDVESSKNPSYLQYDADHFFSASPIDGALKWVVDGGTLALDGAPPAQSDAGSISFIDTSGDDQFAAAVGRSVGVDTDAGTALTYGISGGTELGSTFSKVGTYGTLVVNMATGLLTFTPNNAAIQALKVNATDTFTVTVTDGIAIDDALCTINISGANDLTIFGGNTTAPVSEDGATTANGTLTASDRDTGDAVITAQTNTVGTYGSFSIGTNGAWTYNLNNSAANVQGLKLGQSVNDTFTVATAGGATQNIVVSVNGANDVPAAVNASVSGNEDTAINGTLAASDVDAGALIYSRVNQASRGTVVVNADGSYTYTPAANYNGADSFTFRVNDGTVNSNTATVSIVVSPVNDLPTGDVTITGTPTQGQTLSATNSLVDLDGLGTINYQWLADGTAIVGATAPSFVLDEAQVGKAITVTASYTDGHGTAESVSSAATSAVTDIPPQTINGTAGNDNALTGGPGNDTIDGGLGVDTVLFSGNRSGYHLSKSGNGFQVSDQTPGRNGTDNVQNVEVLRFADMSVDLTIGALAASIPATSLKTLQELYVGFFNRVPEAAGLSYWIGQLKAGVSLAAIADQFYSAGVQFGVYSATMTDAQFITTVYANVLGRTGTSAPNASEIGYWANRLNSAQDTKGTMVLQMLNDSHTFFTNDPVVGWVIDLLDNKAEVANYFAVQQGLSYNVQQDNITYGIAIAAEITPTDTADAIALIGVNAFSMG